MLHVIHLDQLELIKGNWGIISISQNRKDENVIGTQTSTWLIYTSARQILLGKHTPGLEGKYYPWRNIVPARMQLCTASMAIYRMYVESVFDIEVGSFPTYVQECSI